MIETRLRRGAVAVHVVARFEATASACVSSHSCTHNGFMGTENRQTRHTINYSHGQITITTES